MGFPPNTIGNRFDHTGEKETNNDRYICIKAHEHLRGSFSPTVKGKVVPKRPKEGMMKNDVVTFLLKKLFGTFHQQIFISLVLACLVVSLLSHLLLLKAKFFSCVARLVPFPWFGGKLREGWLF